MLECWRHFVLACRVLCSNQISKEQVVLGARDALLLHFCRRTERIFGGQCITPNMHIHCHLRSCIEDYGPLHGFWCYSFERYNGILGSMPNNNRSIEMQLVACFLAESQFQPLIPLILQNILNPFLYNVLALVLLLPHYISKNCYHVSLKFAGVLYLWAPLWYCLHTALVL